MSEDQLSEEQLFNRLANRIVGHWHRYNEDELMIFSLAEAPASLADLTIVKKGIYYSSQYRLAFLPGWLAFITISQWADKQEKTIEVITKDTLVLKDNTGRLFVYQRKADRAFAEEVIDSICEEDEL